VLGSARAAAHGAWHASAACCRREHSGHRGAKLAGGQGDARAQHLLALVAGHVGGAAVSPEHSRLDPGGARAVPAGSAAGVSEVGHSSENFYRLPFTPFSHLSGPSMACRY